jgi:putative sugar O-methyltransferase
MEIKYPELNEIIQKNKIQKTIYQPSSFWEQASKKIIEEITEYGIENFRNLPTPLSFFVPNYGIPANSFNQELVKEVYNLIRKNGNNKQHLAIREFLSGYFHALSDYRVFLASDNQRKLPDLTSFSESNYGSPLEQFEFAEKKYSRSSLNYIQGICFLKSYLSQNEEIKTVLEIGGGFGTLGEILSYSDGIKYIDIDIPPVSFIAWKYLSNIYTSEDIEPFIDVKEDIEIKDLKRCSIFNSWDIEKVKGKVDLFVNFISFQEMEPDIVKNYLDHVKRLNTKWILLRNMSEGKQIKNFSNDTGVEVPIRKQNYIEMIEDTYTLVDSNVFPYGYKTVDGFNSEILLFKKKNA